MLTQQSLEKDYKYFKQQARELIHKGIYDDAIDAIRTAGTIAQNYCLFYADKDIEIMLFDISSVIVRRNEEHCKPVPGRIIFYDSFSRDNVMLTTQYINALNKIGIEFMYLTMNSVETLEKQKFYRQLKENPKAVVCAGRSAMSTQESIEFIVKATEEYRPEKILIHTRAEDICGILPWYQFSEIERYYVEVTDHSYWPGVNAIDYCICFRNYGYSNAVNYRGIQENQLLILPYHPALGDYPYEGIPESIPGSVKLFSGGRVTKVLDKDDTFLNLVKRALECHPNTEFYYAGGGLIDGAARFAHIQRFIKDNGLEQRFHLLGQRKDILEVTRNMDVFINTFPFGGGLMVQIAAMCGLPVVILAKNGLCTSIEEFVKNDAWEKPDITFFSEASADEEIGKLVDDPSYRKDRGNTLARRIVDPAAFAENLHTLLTEKKGIVQPIIHDGDYEIRREINIEMENLVFHRYYGILLRSKLLRKKRPIKYLSAAIKLVIESDKGYLINTVKRYIKK